MSSVDVVLAVDATVTGAAQPRTRFRHRHLAEAPFVIVGYRLAGETAAPLGLLHGTDPNQPTIRVAAEPRNREIRFREAINPFAQDLVAYITPFLADREAIGKPPKTSERCVDAPQIICPNRRTTDFVGGVLGRSLRYLRTDGEFAVPQATVDTGAALTWLSQQAALPGSSVLLAATDLLRRHWATGQSSLEDEDLHVLLAWLDPPPGLSGAEAALDAERHRMVGELPALGPASDPDWDERRLDAAIGEFNENRAGAQDEATVQQMQGPVVDLVNEALLPGWQATWRAIELLRALPARARWPSGGRPTARTGPGMRTGR